MTTDEPQGRIRFGVAGAGATGGYLAATLADAGHDVTLLARGRSAEVIARDGITIDGPGDRQISAKPRVITSEDSIEPVDVTLFCVKAYDTDAAARDISNLVGTDGAILCLQNGVTNEETLAAVHGAERILSGVLYIGAERVEPGQVSCSTPARVILGPSSKGTSEATSHLWAPIARILTEAGIDSSVNEDIRQAKWQKFLFNCGLNPLTALTGRRLGAIRSEAGGRDLYTSLVREAFMAAAAAGAPLSEDASQQAEVTADRMDISSSMAEDLAAGRAMEVDAFTGHVLRLAKEHGTDAPVTEVVHKLLTVLNRRPEQSG